MQELWALRTLTVVVELGNLNSCVSVHRCFIQSVEFVFLFAMSEIEVRQISVI
jgi:hypothetical protein